MKTIFIRQYDAFGDWISINGLPRYLIKEHSYEKVYLVLEQESSRNFVNFLYEDDSRINIIMHRDFENVCTTEDVIDTRYNESYPVVGTGNYWSYQNPFGDYIHNGEASNSDNFYVKLGIDNKIKNEYFFFSRKIDLENDLFNKQDLSEPYSIVCEYGEHLIDKKYLKYSKIVNLHCISPNFVDTLKILENSDDVHLIENSVALFVYHLQAANLLKKFKVHLHAYARKEPHRRCSGEGCDNLYLNMLLLPKLDNWEIIW